MCHELNNAGPGLKLSKKHRHSDICFKKHRQLVIASMGIKYDPGAHNELWNLLRVHAKG